MHVLRAHLYRSIESKIGRYAGPQACPAQVSTDVRKQSWLVAHLSGPLKSEAAQVYSTMHGGSLECLQKSTAGA